MNIVWNRQDFSKPFFSITDKTIFTAFKDGVEIGNVRTFWGSNLWQLYYEPLDISEGDFKSSDLAIARLQEIHALKGEALIHLRLNKIQEDISLLPSEIGW